MIPVRTKSRPRTKARSTSCTTRYDNQWSGNKQSTKRCLSRSASSGRDPRKAKKSTNTRSLHPSPELLTSDITNYQEVNLIKRSRPSRYNTPQTLKFTTDTSWSTPVAKPQRPAHVSKDSTVSSLISNAVTAVPFRRQIKDTKDKNSDDPPLVLSELNNTGSSTISAEATQFIVDQLVKTDANIADLTKKLDDLIQTQGHSQYKRDYNDIDVSSTDLQRALLDNDTLRAQISSMTRAFARDTAETKRRIAATCSLSSTLRSALEKSTIHGMELETKLAAKETQLQRLQWINKNLEVKLAAIAPRVGGVRPSSAGSAKQKKSTLVQETPEKRRRCSSARQESGHKHQAATPAIVISQSLLESLNGAPEKTSYAQERGEHVDRRASAHKHNEFSTASCGLPEVLSIDSVRHFSPPSTPRFHTKAKPLPVSTQNAAIAHKKTTNASSSAQKSAKVSSSSKRSSTHKPGSPQSARQSALEMYAQTALANELSLWKERCTEKDLLVESLERQANELKDRLKEKETQLVSVQQQAMNVLAEKKLLADELSRVKSEAREVVAIPIANMTNEYTKEIQEAHNNEKLLESKLATLEANLSSKDILIANLMAQLQSLKSANEQLSSVEAVVSPSHVSIPPTSNAEARTSGSSPSPSPLTSTSVLKYTDHPSPACNTTELETQVYKVCANSPAATFSQPVNAQQTKADKKEIKRLLKLEKKQEKLMRRATSNSSTSAGSKKGSRASSRNKSAFSHCGGGNTMATEIHEEVDYVTDLAENAYVIANAGTLTAASTGEAMEEACEGTTS